MVQKTHLKINRKLCGEPVEIMDGSSKVRLTTTTQMAADQYGLIHGGFIFGLADYAAMLAVNHPNVVLGSANVKFLKPVKTGEVLIARARLKNTEERKIIVVVKVKRDNEVVFEGEFFCFVPEKHVLA